MKHITYFILITIILAFTGCKHDKVDFNNPDVSTFVAQLKAGTYQTKGPSGFVEVPRFTKADIPELMKYVTDMSTIKDFPLPPNSIYMHAGKFRLGECIMWIIESVRRGGSASEGCQLVRASSHHGESLILSDKEMKKVAHLYRDWWSSVLFRNGNSLANLYSHSPLDNTEYIWN
jgi:hypothetical protein